MDMCRGEMKVDGKRNRRRPRWRDLVREDTARNQITTEMVEDRKHWHVVIRHTTKCRGESVRKVRKLLSHTKRTCEKL